MNRTLQIIFLLLFISKSGFSQNTGSTYSGDLLVLNTTESKKSTKSENSHKEQKQSTLAEQNKSKALETPVNQESSSSIAPAEQAIMPAELATTNVVTPAQTNQTSENTQASTNADLILTTLPMPQEEVGVIFYPNPVRDNLTIQFPQKGTHTVKVFNIIGEKVAEKTVVDDDIVTMNLSNIQPGVLFLSYEYAGKVFTKKFSKN